MMLSFSNQVEAFKAAALIIVNIKGYQPQRPNSDMLRPSVQTGGRPAYSLLQLYHAMSLHLASNYLSFMFLCDATTSYTFCQCHVMAVCVGLGYLLFNPPSNQVQP